VLTIVIPMAGRGSRFADAGYELPKPLIPVHGTPMIELVVSNLRPRLRDARFVFVCQREHIERYGIDRRLREIAPGCAVVAIDGITEGAACTVLLAADEIDPGDTLVIANSDQWVDVDIDEHLALLDSDGLDGLIMTMWADHPKWSYVRFDDAGRVSELVEKEVVSNEATVGIYAFRRGGDFVRAAREMIAAEKRVNGEFYVAPVYNELIAEGATLGVDNVGTVDDGMYGLGVPDDLERFLAMPISLRAAGAATDRAA
jgi:NDP-sugar pyrophosphorylase family protein